MIFTTPVLVETFGTANVQFTCVESLAETPFNGLELDSIGPCQVLCICSELSAVHWCLSTRKAEVSWKEFWKYNVSPLHCHTRHSWGSAAVSYTLDYWRCWDEAAYLCMNISLYPHLSYHLMKWRSQTAVRGCSVFSLVSLTGKGFSEIISFWYRDLNYREPTGISSQPELIPDRTRKLICVMAVASWLMVLCGYVTPLFWVKLWCKKRVVSVEVIPGKLLPGSTVVQFPLQIPSLVWWKDQPNACRRVLHSLPYHSAMTQLC